MKLLSKFLTKDTQHKNVIFLSLIHQKTFIFLVQLLLEAFKKKKKSEKSLKTILYDKSCICSCGSACICIRLWKCNLISFLTKTDELRL